MNRRHSCSWCICGRFGAARHACWGYSGLLKGNWGLFRSFVGHLVGCFRNAKRSMNRRHPRSWFICGRVCAVWQSYRGCSGRLRGHWGLFGSFVGYLLGVLERPNESWTDDIPVHDSCVVVFALCDTHIGAAPGDFGATGGCLGALLGVCWVFGRGQTNHEPTTFLLMMHLWSCSSCAARVLRLLRAT